MTIWGFTGAREGTTHRQRLRALAFLDDYGVKEWHFGDAPGADSRMHAAIVQRYWPNLVDIYSYPCRLPLRNHPVTHAYPSKPPLERNHDIVDACDRLMALPASEEVIRSGTWATVRYARKVRKPVVIVYPNGSVKYERWK